MTHWEYLDEPHDVINRELRMHHLREQRRGAGRAQPPPTEPGPPSIT